MALRIKRGDTVVILTGKDKGSTGKVMRVDPRKKRVYVEGLGMQYKHVKRSQQSPKGGRVHREGPLNISNVAIWSEKSKTGQRFKVERADRKAVRVGVKDGANFE